MTTPIAHTFSKPAAALAVAALLLGAGEARAGRFDTEPVSEVVHFGDLDVGTDAGVKRLYLRLDRAAERVCGDTRDAFDMRSVYRRCERAALEDAVQQVSLPKLAAEVARHFPERSAAAVVRVTSVARAPAIVLVG
jgi:UrcA family protein